MSRRFLNFEIPNDGDSVLTIAANQEGLDDLIGFLQRLRADGPGNHDHLMTPSWGGWELSEKTPQDGNALIHQVNIFYRPDEDA